MDIIGKSWIELRELPDAENSEISYICLQDIERISLIENESDNTHSIFVSALGAKYLYDTVDTLEEAKIAAKSLVEEIEKFN